LWILGRVDDARSAVGRVFHQAECSGHPVALAVALHCTQVWLWSGDWDAADIASRRLMAHAEEHSLISYRSTGLGLIGELAVLRGQTSVGLEALQQATGLLHRNQFRLFFQLMHFPALATALGELGRVEEAMAAIDDALAVDDGVGGSCISPELLRVKGTLLARYIPGRRPDAESFLYQSYERARQQGALAWELRAAMSLAQHHPPSASLRGMLRETYSKFSQGFDTRDLILARELLTQMRKDR
jgi:hypothetical protein